jgi:hypothetical protein
LTTSFTQPFIVRDGGLMACTGNRWPTSPFRDLRYRNRLAAIDKGRVKALTSCKCLRCAGAQFRRAHHT